MREIAAATAELIGRLGGGFMISREAKAFADEVSPNPWASYFRGRFGVLGDVDADVITSAAGFFPADTVRQAWEAAGHLPASEAAATYAGVAHAFARRKLAGFQDSARLADLLRTVADNADVTAAPVFAGWRALPLPADDHARAIQLAHVIRELRNGLHIVAILACGLTPLEAVLSGKSALLEAGEAGAQYFGWPSPYPEVTDDIRQRRAEAEDLTDTLMTPAYSALDKSEADELITLLTKADQTVFTR